MLDSNNSLIKATIARLIGARIELFWVAFGQLLALSGMIAGVKILTNIMTEEGYGHLALAMTITGILSSFIYGPLANAVMRYFSVCLDRGELGAYLSVIKENHIKIVWVIFCVGIPIVLIANWMINSFWAVLILIAILIAIVNGINGSFYTLLSAIRKRKIVALHQGAFYWLRAILAFTCIILFTNNANSALLGYLLGTLAVAFSQGLFTFCNEKLQEHTQNHVIDAAIKEKIKVEIFSYAKNFGIIAVAGIVSLYADRWFLQGLFGARQVGIYAAIFQIASAPVVLVFGFINQLMVPIIFEKAGSMRSQHQVDRSTSLLHKTALFAVITMVPINLIAYLYGEPILLLLTSEVFAAHHHNLWIIMLGLSFTNLGELLAVKGLKKNQPGIYIVPKAIQSITFLIFGFFIIKSYNIFGVAIALCCSSLLYLLMVLYVNSKITFETELPLRD